MMLNFKPDKFFLEMSRLKEFAKKKLNLAPKMISVCDRIENILGKGENAINLVNSIFSFPTMFSKALFLKIIENRD